MVIHIVRALYLVVVLAITVSYSFQAEVTQKGPLYVTLYILVPALLAFGVVMADMFWRRKNLQALSGLFFGLVAGLVIAYVVNQVANLVGDVFTSPAGVTATQQADTGHVEVILPREGTPLPTTLPAPSPRASVHPGRDGQAIHIVYHRPEVDPQVAGDSRGPVLDLAKVLLGASAVFMCVSFILQTKDDFRFVIPYVEFSKQTKGARPILLDTSVIIDGRIADIAETRILESEVIVPRFVLAELQTIADSNDKLKRNRGRRGLDVLNRLQSSQAIEIRIFDPHEQTVQDASGVDAKLVALGDHLDARVVTNDYNLNKIAKLRGVDVININDLANALKPVVLPGETMNVKIIKPGEESGQGVGYLDDGTMVVVEQGREAIGRSVGLTVTSVLQTSAGRMIFGRLDADKTYTPRGGRDGKS
jgi:uncharacterized protein YacL